MKKIIYTLLISLSIAFAFTACTEEEVKPQEQELQNGGGSISTGTL